jgi:hypothetical protein
MKKLALFVLIVCLFIGTVYANPAKMSDAKQLHMGDLVGRAFEASEAEAEGYYVHNWSIVNDRYLSVRELSEMANRLNAVLQIPNAKENRVDTDRQHVYQLYGRWDPSTAVSLILTTMNLEDKQPQTVLVVKIEREDDHVQDIARSVEKVKSTVESIGVKPQISTCIKGFYNDRIDTMGRNQLIQRVFQAVNAKETEGVRSELLSSVSGYSPIFREYIMTNGKRMNLQVAVHYDEYRKMTRILVGSPIVTIEY